MNEKIILTLDAGGTSFKFAAIQGGHQIGDTIILPSHADDLEHCLESLKKGFHQVKGQLDNKPDAISFAFPGPADYKNGVIGDLPNLTAFRGGVPLGSILEAEFKIPVFINNDGDLFTYGESKAGFLPWVNQILEEAGNPKRYKNLIGVTLGTGFGAGISINGALLKGDNGAASEAWKLRNVRHPYSSVEDTLSIKAIKRMYAEQIAIDPAKAPEPVEIYKISRGESEGVQPAAREAFLRYGEVLGDALAQIITMVDGLVVIGGGISGAYPVFASSMMDHFNSRFSLLDGKQSPRLIQKMYNLEQDRELESFLEYKIEELSYPGLKEKVGYEENKKLAVGLSRLGTDKAIMAGAYYYAVSQLLDQDQQT